MRFSDLTFRAQVLVGCLVALIVTDAPLSAYQMIRERGNQKTTLHEAAEHMAGNMARTLALPLWDFNYPFLDDLMAGLADDEFVKSAELSDSTGEVVATYKQAVHQIETWADTRVIEQVTFSDHGDQIVLGRLTMNFSGAPAAEAARQFAVSRLISFLILCVMVAVALYVVLGAILTPLRNLVSSIRRIEGGELNDPISDVDRSDEIGRVASALDHLRLVEQELRSARAERDSQTATERRRLLLALQSTDDGVIVVDEDNCVVLQNKRSVVFFGDWAKGTPLESIPALIKTDNDTGDVIRKVKRDNVEKAFRLRTDTILDTEGKTLGKVILASEVTEQLKQQERADYLSCHDVLTDLPNRRSLNLAFAEIGDADCGLLLCDLDRFKQVNDTLGHSIGDQILTNVAAILRSLADDQMVPIRLGGDEFAIFARDADSAMRLTEVADGLLQAMDKPLVIDGRSVECGISIGIARLPNDAAVTTELMQIADAALYQAKNEGRGRLCEANPKMRQAATRRQMIENALRDALTSGEGPLPVYQKQTCSETREIVGFEALARWKVPSSGEISPGEFIPIAEETGLIVLLTARVLESACIFARQLRDRGFVGRVSVNASPILFGGTLTALLDEALSKTGCEPAAIEIEITEQVVLSDRADVIEEIEALRARGVSISLDDFGMGYSSLSYLQRFPVDKIKIDRTFVADISRKQERRAIVCAIVGLAQALGMTVTAEGAETEEDRATVARCGVDTIQGWVDGRPMHSDRIIADVSLSLRGVGAVLNEKAS